MFVSQHHRYLTDTLNANDCFINPSAVSLYPLVRRRLHVTFFSSLPPVQCQMFPVSQGQALDLHAARMTMLSMLALTCGAGEHRRGKVDANVSCAVHTKHGGGSLLENNLQIVTIIRLKLEPKLFSKLLILRGVHKNWSYSRRPFILCTRTRVSVNIPKVRLMISCSLLGRWDVVQVTLLDLDS